jgi:hypothetical protein
MSVQRSEDGQLLLPMLAVLFLFGLFWVTYVLWCRHVYWRMRMDMAADATALSAMREEAAMLNTIGTMQYLENRFLQKVKLFGEDVAGVQIENANTFDQYNASMTELADWFYPAYAVNVARTVAQANGATQSPLPVPFPQNHLKAQELNVHILDGVIPVGERYYKAAYYARDWWPNKTAPQPIHRETWTVCHDGICEKGKARLWLDVDGGNVLNNGGFPSEHASFWRSLGIQCQYPQFNARLLPKN